MQIVRTITKQFLYTTFLLMYCVLHSYAQPNPTNEYQVKAAFLFNFTQFVDWPSNALASAESPIVIGILGEDPFGTYLNETISDEKVNGHRITIQHYKSIEEAKACQVLFINLAEKKKMERALAYLKDKNILTVSDATDFLDKGGMIRFILKNNRIQLQVNLEAAKAANLNISSKLLRLVEIYTPKK